MKRHVLLALTGLGVSSESCMALFVRRNISSVAVLCEMCTNRRKNWGRDWLIADVETFVAENNKKKCLGNITHGYGVNKKSDPVQGKVMSRINAFVCPFAFSTGRPLLRPHFCSTYLQFLFDQPVDPLRDSLSGNSVFRDVPGTSNIMLTASLN